MNVIFEEDFTSVWESFSGISELNCMICTLISTNVLGFTCFKSLYRFWFCEPSYL